MTVFEKLAFSQKLLRTQSGLQKQALLGALWGAAKGVGSMAGSVGKAGLWAGKKALFNSAGKFSPMRTLGVGLGVMGVGSEIKGGLQKRRAYQTGFDPNVQAAQSTPQ